MKNYHLLATLIAIAITCLASCEKTISVDVYFYNKLDNNINLEIFKNKEKINFELIPNDSIYFDSFNFNMNPNIKYFQFPGDIEYTSFLHDIDSVNVFYNSEKDTYLNDSIFKLFYLDGFWLIRFNEYKKQQFGWK